MVIRRTIHSLRQRSHDERRAFAGICAIAVMGIFFVGWSTSFLRTMHRTTADQSAPQAHTDTVSAQVAASAAPSLNSLVETIYPDNASVPVPIDTSHNSTTDMNPVLQNDAVPPASSVNDAAEQLQSALQGN